MHRAGWRVLGILVAVVPPIGAAPPGPPVAFGSASDLVGHRARR